jgi:Ca-activated chloride channel family protein
VLQRVLDLAPNEPQSWRDLGLAQAEAGDRQQAVESLYQVVTRPWHNRFPDIELVALAEMNALIATAPSGIDTSAIDPRFLRNLPLDLRVLLAWDADNTDIDLWVTDPNGEKALLWQPPDLSGRRDVTRFHRGLRTRGVFPEKGQAWPLSRAGAVLRTPPASSRGSDDAQSAPVHRFR